MAQELANLRQRGTSTQQLRRCGVTQLMGMDMRKTSALGSRVHYLCYAAFAQGMVRSPDPHKHGPVFRVLRASTLQIGDHRFSNVGGQWHAFSAFSLAVNNDLTGSPIDIAKLKRRHFAYTQPKSDE